MFIVLVEREFVNLFNCSWQNQISTDSIRTLRLCNNRGRAGKNGISYTFFQPGDKSHAGELQQVMRQAGQNVPEELLKFGSTIKKKEHKLYGNFGPKDGPMKKAVKITFDSDDE